MGGRSRVQPALRRPLLLLVLAAGAAHAQTLQILGPGPGPVPPDGFAIAVLRRGTSGAPEAMQSPQVTADGADLRPAIPYPPLQTFLVVPHLNAREVRIRAVDGKVRVEARFAVGPPAARVELSL